MNRKLAGALVLVVAVGGSLAWYFMAGRGGGGAGAGLLAPRAQAKLAGAIGSEKAGFLDDPELVSLLAGRYGLSLSYAKVGSIEQVQPQAIGANDFLWPSSQVAVDIFRAKNPDLKAKTEIIFNTPIVLYTWDKVDDALERAGIVRLEGGVRYVRDMPKLLDLALSGAAWSDLGLSQIYGKVNIIPTDPAYSNSGLLFAGLAADLLAGDVATEATLDKALPKLTAFFRRQGFMERSTGNLFEQFLSKGMGGYPIIVGYENQIVEYGRQNPELWAKMKGRLRILYPSPTVWSSHTLISLEGKADGLIEALRGKDAQGLAWRRHGFRPATVGVPVDAPDLAAAGIPDAIDAVAALPSAAVMERILAALAPAAP